MWASAGLRTEFNCSKAVEVGWSCHSCEYLQLCQREIATDEIKEEKIIESAAM